MGECPGSFRLRERDTDEYVGTHPLRRTDRSGAMIFLGGDDVRRSGLDESRYYREYLLQRGDAPRLVSH